MAVPLLLHPLDHLYLVQRTHAAAGDVLDQAGEQPVGLRQAAHERGNLRLTERFERFQPALPAHEIERLPAVVTGFPLRYGDRLFESELRDAFHDAFELRLVAHAWIHDPNPIDGDQAHARFACRRHAASSTETRSAIWKKNSRSSKR